MASIEKRIRRGKRKTTTKWQLAWYDAGGARHRKNFPTKGAAEAYRDTVVLAPGGRLSGHYRATVGDAAEAMIRHYEELVHRGDRERSTLKGYEQNAAHLKADAELWKARLAELRTADCQAAVDRLAKRVSRDKAKRCLHTLRLICKHGIRQGWAAVNPAEAVALPAVARHRDKRQRVEAPPLDQVGRVMDAAGAIDGTGRAEAMVSLLVFAGLRASEMIGLARDGVHLTDKEPSVSVSQRVDQFGKLGWPKSPAAYRTVPIGPHCASVLRAWLLRAPHSAFAFPVADGSHDTYRRFYEQIWLPVAARARLVLRWKLNRIEGHLRPVPAFGPHALRHAAATIWIGQGVAPKQLQTWMGHEQISTTMDLYGHLYRDRESEQAHAAAMESAVLAHRSR